MNKKSLNCVESETSSSRTELSNPAIQDIIATNNVILGKEPHRGRFSRACKAVIFIIIFGFFVLGIIALTLVLANSRNRYLAWANRLNDEKIVDRFNTTNRLYVEHKNLTRDFGQKENNDVSSEDKVEYRPTSTVILTSDNFEGETTKMDNLHRSSLIMHTKEMNDEDFSSQTLSMKPYPSSNTITNEPSTSSTTSTTVQTMTTTTTTTTSTTTSELHIYRTTEANRITTEGEFVTITNNSQSDESLTSTTDIPTTSTTSIQNEQTTTVMTEGLFTTFFNSHFNLDSSTTTKKRRQKLSRLNQDIDDFLDDLVFS